MSNTSGFGAVLRDTAPVGVAVGAAAFVLNYLLISLFVIIDGVESSGKTEGWKFSGNVLYNAQFVETDIEIEITMPLGGGTETTMETLNLVRQTASNDKVLQDVTDLGVTATVPSLVYHAVPILVLALAGAAVVRYAGPYEAPTEAVIAALTIVPATLVLSVVGVVLFDGSFDGNPAAPAMLAGVALVGVVIPAVVGTVGGVVGQQL